MRVIFNKDRKDIFRNSNKLIVGTKGIKEDDAWRNLGFSMARFAINNKINKLMISDAPPTSQSFIEGSILGKYKYTLKSKKEKELVISYTGTGDEFEAMVEKARSVAEAQIVTKDLVNTPPNIANSEYIMRKVISMFLNTSIEVEIYNKRKLIELDMNGHLAVNGASANEPLTIKLSYNPAQTDTKVKHHVFVGKGLTYDSGGLSIKPSPSMVNMQADKAGAMTLIGLMNYVARNGTSSKVTVYLAIAENMINEEAYRPGDILTMKNGKTVKIK